MAWRKQTSQTRSAGANLVAVALTLPASIDAFGFIDRVMIVLIAKKIEAEFLLTDVKIGLLGGPMLQLPARAGHRDRPAGS